jgi:hypothetical protein
MVHHWPPLGSYLLLQLLSWDRYIRLLEKLSLVASSHHRSEIAGGEPAQV